MDLEKAKLRLVKSVNALSDSLDKGNLEKAKIRLVNSVNALSSSLDKENLEMAVEYVKIIEELSKQFHDLSPEELAPYKDFLREFTEHTREELKRIDKLRRSVGKELQRNQKGKQMNKQYTAVANN